MENQSNPAVATIEVHEEMMQHFEDTGGRTKILSLITILVTLLLSAADLSQIIVVPYLLGSPTVTVNLLDPLLVAFEVAILILTLAWLYVGIRDYVFSNRVLRQVKEIRRAQQEIEARMGRSKPQT